MEPSFGQVLLRYLQLGVVAAVLGAAAASGAGGGATRRWVTFALVSAIALALLLALRRAWRRLLAFPADEYGPLAHDRARYTSYLRKVAKLDRNRVERWKVQAKMREAFERARSADDLDRAEGHLARAQETLEAWRDRFRVPRRERQALERRFRDDWLALRTIAVVHAVEAQLEHARGLKTERGRARARAAARSTLERGMADPRADEELLLRLGRETGLLKEDAQRPAPARAAARSDPPRWVGCGGEVEVHGRRLRGPLWVGADPDVAEPALVDPALPVAQRGRTADVPPDPSYAELTPSGRAAFLDWLAGGRRGDAPRGFARLVYFGIERRLLGAPAESVEVRREVPDLVAELERGAAGAGNDRRLASAARTLALHASLRFPFEVGADEDPGPLTAPDGALPARLRLALARKISGARPLSAAWARAWLHHATSGALRTPARRAPEDFERLFRLRYEERFGAGLVVAPGPTALRVVHRALSPSFASEAFHARLDLPDPEASVGVVDRLDALADACCEELAGLSRFLGRADGRAPDLRVLATLPRELLAWHDEPPLESLRGLLRELEEDEPPRFVDAARLTELWPGRGRIARADCARFARLLGKLGHGVEPDPRFGGPPWPEQGPVALFPLASDAPRAPSRAYEAAALVVHVAVTLASADQAGGDALAGAEEEALREHLDASLVLPSAESRRLEVHLAWLRRHPPRLAGLKRRVERLDEAGRDRLAEFLLRIACADGVVKPAEVRLLERLYALLGRDPAQVHGDLHRRSSGAPATAASEQAEPGLALDPARLAQKLAETRRVAALLGDVFQEDEVPVSDAPEAEEGPTYAGLDVAHSALLARLATREEWPRAEVEELADGLGLLPDGALDALNDAAYEAADDPLWEGDDPLWVDVALAGELTGASGTLSRP